MAKRLGINPITHPRTTAGALITNGTVTITASGGSTAVSIYSEKDQSGYLPDPVSLSSGGLMPLVWLAQSDGSSGTFRFLTKDSDSATVYTQDEVETLGTLGNLTANLVVNGKTITSASNGNILITPQGSGQIVLDTHYWPTDDGTANYVLKTNGAGVISFVTNGISVPQDTTPQLGGDLDANSYDIKMDTMTGIRDDSDNEQLLFNAVTTAANYLTVTNAATGNNPIITAAGSDTNVGINLVPKGTSTVKLSSIAYPVNDGTNGQFLKTDGSGALTFATVDYQANQASMEEATSNTEAVSPGRLQYHPGVCKAWIYIDNQARVASYNVSSISFGAGGELTLNWSTAFSSTGYVVVGHGIDEGTPGKFYALVTKSLATGSAIVQGWTNVGFTANSPTDYQYFIAAYGDQ